jgi:Ni,Fe-hydrogenase III small subunit
MRSTRTRSPWVFHYNATSCNGCVLELFAAFTSRYDPERFGVLNVGNPKHADIFLVTGAVNPENLEVLRSLYDQMAAPKVVVAVGLCAASGCVFYNAYNILGGADVALTVDVYVPGCAARPEAIIDGLLEAAGVLHEKRAQRGGDAGTRRGGPQRRQDL